ncbi:MAG: isoprenylcysteine carboxylmethyltransferase family protein [Alphaproteobacteria bacterium]|nr:isoprenylcysteine carboxylmethyltransferase family protein [Alphaproteobacteria bacterium]
MTSTLRHRIDLAIRGVLALFFAFSAGMYVKNALAHFNSVAPGQFDAHVFAQGLSTFAIGVFTMMIACVYVLRFRPVNKFAGIWPTTAALLGGFLMSGMLIFDQRTDLSLSVQLFASFLIIGGNIFAVYILSHLGRSFSILPESRKLVTKGPYKIIRHPLYAAEAVATIGAMISFLSVGAVLLVAAQLSLQLVRIHYEERVLTKSFPEYKNYAKKTARLIPGLY